jgi:hypothetical protein
MEAIIVILFAGTATVGGYIVRRCMENLAIGRRSETWPSVEGVIVSSALDAHPHDEINYRANVTYRYEIAGSQLLIPNKFEMARKLCSGPTNAAGQSLRIYSKGRCHN